MSDIKAEWRRQRIAVGLCLQCPSQRTGHATLCDPCEKRKRLQRRLRDRVKHGWSAWQPGSRGRQPID